MQEPDWNQAFERWLSNGFRALPPTGDYAAWLETQWRRHLYERLSGIFIKYILSLLLSFQTGMVAVAALVVAVAGAAAAAAGGGGAGGEGPAP